MRTRSGETVILSGIGINSDYGLPSEKKHSGQPMSHKGSTDIAHGLDIGDTANAHVQDGEVLSSRSNEHDGLPQEVYIKSEPLYEDLCEVLDELGEILDEEQDDVLDKRQGNNIDRDQGEIMDKEQAELDEEEADTPPAPSISLTDDASLFTRRSRPYADDSPLSFNGSLYEHGEISSSEEGQKEPVRGKNLHEIALVRFRNSPEQSLKRCSINAGFSSENKINRRSNRSTSNEKSATQRRSISRSRIPRCRGRRRSKSRSPTEPKQRSSPPTHKRRSRPSIDHIRSRKRSHSRDRMERRSRLPSRRKHISRSRSPDRKSRSRYVRDSPLGKGSRHASPCGGSRHRSLRSPSVRRRLGPRNSPVRRSRYRSRSNSRPIKHGVQHRIESRAYLRDRSRSRGRSASKSKSVRITQRELSKRACKSRSKSIHRPLKTVVCRRSRSRSNSPHTRLRRVSKSSSQPAHIQQLNNTSPPLPAISPRPISPMVTLHDNRTSYSKEMIPYLLPTPNVPQIFYRQTNYTHTEYSAEYSAGNVTGSFGQPFPELGPYDLRHRLSTTRSLHYVGPNDLRHHIQGIYSHQTAFNAYTEWPSVFTENYHPSGYY
ncbi:serine/arginine repetitive matrix protein 2 [Drosophila simulans]|uniref:Uncharacterized protein n=1 Tax=Drosophila simulans TaxID=7240 RepID=A0A0J9S1E6_DROSI|nr:serine/arginine repetitive matrix protein 2 [Drosophila simulans]KMZ01215.1 uncharacterized protein Dsimw501_GD15048 [Drosophila simulans]